jgi:hypothetical protein
LTVGVPGVFGGGTFGVADGFFTFSKTVLI